jgi:hypothetical protein
VAVWGDSVITSLRARVRAVYQAGRFVGSENGEALFALPNAAHLRAAEPLRSEVAAALSHHLGRPVTLRLLAETDPAAPGAPGGGYAREPDDEDDTVDPEELVAEAGGARSVPAVSWVTDRLLQAFPGAEEV